MKINTVAVIVFALLISNTFTKLAESAEKKKKKRIIDKKQKPQEGKITDAPEDKGTDAVAYNYDKFEKVAPDALDFGSVQTKKPIYVDSLNSNDFKRFSEEKGKKVSPVLVGDEKESAEYYDGTSKIQASNSDCEMYNEDEASCLSKGHCGICDDDKSCVAGTSKGPLKACKSYRYFANPTSK